MDGAAYHSGFDKEHSDYERQKVLLSKGWDLYRIWSTNWLNDQGAEFNKLTQAIDKKLSLPID
jgi:very-short-patch-repair endonuclease